MPDEKQPEDVQDAQPKASPEGNAELSEQELDNVNGGAQPHMVPPGPPANTLHNVQFVGDVNGKIK